MISYEKKCKSFAIVLGGGGARGFAHAGVLRALERRGWLPSAIVGVSMGAVIGAAYALREDWFRAVLDFATEGFAPMRNPLATADTKKALQLRRIASGAKAVWDLGHGWGASAADVRAGRDALEKLVGGADLKDARVPIAVSATDLLSGERVVMRRGPAAVAVYASSALAGVLPPARVEGHLLADGAYTDICPIDVAREVGCDRVMAVNPGRSDVVEDIWSGLQGLIRATEICYLHHAALRFQEADIVLTPPFRRAVETLEFTAYRECVAAGVRAVRVSVDAIGRVLSE